VPEQFSNGKWICKHCAAAQRYGGIGRDGKILWHGCSCPEPKLIDPVTGAEGVYTP
jgi:hypothetical protein